MRGKTSVEPQALDEEERLVGQRKKSTFKGQGEGEEGGAKRKKKKEGLSWCEQFV